jgi:hypothetical protein
LSLAYARKSPNGAFWVPILEKAGAKYFGGYEYMEGGWMNEAWWIFTGMPTTKFFNSKTSNSIAWSKL